MDQELQTELLRVVANIPSFNPNRHYWFVRTNGGDFYEDFYVSESIGIGYNNVTIVDVKAAAIGKKKGRQALIDKIKETYADTTKAGYVVKQMSTFVFELSVGDIVMVPDKSSRNISFGEIIGDAFELPGRGNWDDSKEITTFRKRRKVRWIKTVLRATLDANLQTFTHSQHIISNITDKADYIDRTLFPLYKSGNATHGRIDVNVYNALRGKDLFQFGASLFALTDELLEDAGETATTDDVEVKTKIQSPGYIELIHPDPVVVVLAVALVGWLTLGGRIKATYDGAKADFEASTPGGLMKQITEFLDAREDRKLRRSVREKLIQKLEASGDKMDVSTHLEILRLVNTPQPPQKQLPAPDAEKAPETGTE
jgi:restriction system protein